MMLNVVALIEFPTIIPTIFPSATIVNGLKSAITYDVAKEHSPRAVVPLASYGQSLSADWGVKALPLNVDPPGALIPIFNTQHAQS